MKFLFILFPLLFTICDQGMIPDPPSTIRGEYYGNLKATYPGADDNPVTVEDSIRFIFTDATFIYYWIDGNEAILAGSGSYILESNVTFNNIMEPTINPYLKVDGVFSIRWVHLDAQPDNLILSQGGTPGDPNGFFENIYLITLVKSYETTD